MSRNRSCPCGSASRSLRVDSTRTSWVRATRMAQGIMDSSRSAIGTGVHLRTERNTTHSTIAMWTALACWATILPWPFSAPGSSRNNRVGRPGPSTRSSAMGLWKPSTSVSSRATPQIAWPAKRSKIVRDSLPLCHHCRNMWICVCKIKSLITVYTRLVLLNFLRGRGELTLLCSINRFPLSLQHKSGSSARCHHGELV